MHHHAITSRHQRELRLLMRLYEPQLRHFLDPHLPPASAKNKTAPADNAPRIELSAFNFID